MKHTMTVLSIAGPVWLVRDSDPQVRALFGTDTLPTPYRGIMSGHEVVAALQALNPDAVVVLEDAPLPPLPPRAF